MSVATRVAVSVGLILTAASGQAVAQQFVCYPIRPGDTAARLAQRLTGDPDNRQTPWFRIVDPATWRVVSKSQYDAIRPDWLACVAATPIAHRRTRPGSGSSVAALVLPATPDFRSRLETIDLRVVAGWAAFCLLAILLVWSIARRCGRRTQTTLHRMKAFGEMFISEFERPLRPYGSSDRPIRSRVRCMPHRRRLDILLAPDGGRCYPNLSDHKKNVEYDVERITQCLRDEPFVSGRLYAQGPWVVIPFELKPNARTEGAP